MCCKSAAIVFRSRMQCFHDIPFFEPSHMLSPGSAHFGRTFGHPCSCCQATCSCSSSTPPTSSSTTSPAPSAPSSSSSPLPLPLKRCSGPTWRVLLRTDQGSQPAVVARKGWRSCTNIWRNVPKAVKRKKNLLALDSQY